MKDEKNMYKKLAVLSIALISMVCCAQDVSRIGIVNMSCKTLTNLTITGVANLEEIEVANNFIMSGPLNALACKFGSANISGAVNFDQVMIAQNLIVSGAFSSNKCLFSNVDISGGIAINDSIISGNIKMSGGISCTKAILHNDLNLSGNGFVFSDCKIMKSIKIAPLSWFGSLFKIQKINLDNTVVHGDIIFAEDGGIVEISDSVTIHGKVVGGKIVCKK